MQHLHRNDGSYLNFNATHLYVKPLQAELRFSAMIGPLTMLVQANFVLVLLPLTLFASYVEKPSIFYSFLSMFTMWFYLLARTEEHTVLMNLCVLGILTLAVKIFLSRRQAPILYYKNKEDSSSQTSTMASLLMQMPSLHRVITPPFWCFNSNLQLVPWMIFNMVDSKPKWDDVEVLTMANGGHVKLFWLEPTSQGDLQTTGGDAVPTVIVFHGLTCDGEDTPGVSTVKKLAANGMRVISYERRAHSKDLPLQRLAGDKPVYFNVYGHYEDTVEVLQHIKRIVGRSAPVFGLGMSSGCTTLLNYLCRSKKDTLLDGAVMLSGAINIIDAQDDVHGFYGYIFLNKCQSFFLGGHAQVLREANPEAYRKCMEAKDVTDFLECTYPFSGFDSFEEYLAATSPVHGNSDPVKDIHVPTLFVGSKDDKIIRPRGLSSYHNLFTENVHCAWVLLSSGGHLPFYEGLVWPSRWNDQCALEFLLAAVVNIRSHHKRF